MTRTLVQLIADADFGDNPPAAGTRFAIAGTELDAGPTLHQAVLGTRHGPLHDLAINQLDALLENRRQVIVGLELTGFHQVGPAPLAIRLPRLIIPRSETNLQGYHSII